NRKRQAVRVEKLYQTIGDRRTDFLHKVSTAIARLSDTIVTEDLNVQGMMQNHHLAKSIADVSWYRFKQMLQYKSEWRGIEFIEIGRFEPSSKMCSGCGSIKHNLKLSDRTYHCNNCGLEMDRGLNAAINIRNMGLIKVGKDIPEFTPVEIATSAELF
ncbi:IS605 family transposase OrfB, partial [mine drainage metagenome]